MSLVLSNVVREIRSFDSVGAIKFDCLKPGIY